MSFSPTHRGAGQPVLIPTPGDPVGWWPNQWSGALAKQYGAPIPMVFGTGRVDAKTLWIGAQYDVPDVQIRDDTMSEGGWRTGSGKVAPCIVGLCEGPISRVLRVWRWGSCNTSLRWLTRPKEVVPFPQVLLGDGTETAWGGQATSVIKEDSYDVPPGQRTFTVPQPENVTADLGAWHQRYDEHSSPRWEPYAHTFTSGTYDFNTITYEAKTVKVRRDLSLTAGWTHPMAYRRIAQIRFDALSVTDNKAQDLKVEVIGLCGTITDVRTAQHQRATYAKDCNPADVLLELLCNPIHGLGWSTSSVDVDTGSDGLSASSFRTWCTAMGFVVSRTITEVTPTAQLVEELLDACWAKPVRTGSKIRIVPMGQSPEGAYQPPAIAYHIESREDYIAPEGQDPIRVQRVLPEDTFTICPISFLDRNADYEEVIVEKEVDDPFVNASSTPYAGYEQPPKSRRADAKSMPWISTPLHAAKISVLMAMRSLYVRNTYHLVLGPKWQRIEPGDFLALTESIMGLEAERVLVTSISEGAGGTLEVYAEEAPFLDAPVPAISIQDRDGFSSTTAPGVYVVSEIQSSQHDIDASLSGRADNIFPNPTSEMQPLAGADPFHPAWKGRVAVPDAYAGAYVRRIVGDGAERQIPVDVTCAPGQAFYIEAQCRQTAGTSGVGVAIVFLDVDGNGLGGGSVGDTNVTTSVWDHKCTAYAMAPDQAVQCRFYLFARDGTTGEFDAIYARQIVDNSLVPTQLFGTITGGAGYGATVTGPGLVSVSHSSTVSTLVVQAPLTPPGRTRRAVVQAMQIRSFGTQYWALGFTAHVESIAPNAGDATKDDIVLSFWYQSTQANPADIPNWAFDVFVQYFFV
jgi:hypothetical protein